jgi:HAD superfamily phosphatase (TIGR01668 family)
MYVDSLLDIPLPELWDKNIRAFILDLDNTITEWNSNELKHEVENWFELIKSMGFQACILSNNGKKRTVQIADRLGIPFIHRARKPRRHSFLRAAALMGTKPDETAVIGDQVFTDVLGGNRAGLFTILIKPLSRREFIGTKFARSMEFFVLRSLRHKLDRETNGEK